MSFVPLLPYLLFIPTRLLCW